MLDRARASLVKFLCLLPFIVSVMVPVGLMPAVSSEGAFTLVICTGHGLEERSVPATDDEPESASAWCPFSLLSVPALAPARIDQGGGLQVAAVYVGPIERDSPATTDVATSRPRGP
ncbi:MAG: hypothetical protein ACR2RE_10205, partial [Geminicoccaceae bacterium]